MAYIKVPLKNIFSVDKIISIFEKRLAPDFYYEGESHDFWELRYVREGEIDIHAGTELFHMASGDIFFHRPGEFHDIICDGEHSADIIIMSFDCHSAAMEYFDHRIISLPQDLRNIIHGILDYSKGCFTSGLPITISPGAPFGSEQLLRGDIEGFLIRLIQLEERQGLKSLFTSREELVDRLASDILEYLEKNVYERLTLDDIAEHFHFGKSHICHVFKGKYGVGIKHYYLDLKLEEGKRQLFESDAAIYFISDSLKFESPQHFAKLFKKKFGIAPTEYRKQHKADK